MAFETLTDFSVYGDVDNMGGLLVHEGDLAISNGLITFLTSKSGDFIYQPQLGGILERLIFQVMTPDKTAALVELLTKSLTDNFGTVIEILSLTVTPDNELRRYIIDIIYRSLLTNKEVRVSFKTSKKPIEDLVKDFTDVSFIGDNLINFVLQKLPDMKGIKLTQDPVTNIYIWGQFRLVNLKNTDYNFDAVNDLIFTN